MTATPARGGREVLVVMNIPTPYRVPLFNELSRQLDAAGYRLRVIFGAMGYAGRKWTIAPEDFRFDYQVLPSRSYRIGGESDTFTYSGLYALLSGSPPPIVVVIGFSPATLKLWWRSLWRQTPYVIWSGALPPNPYRPVSVLRRLQRRLLVKRAAGFIAYGTAARENLIAMGAPADRVHIAINTVDTDYFRTRTAELAAVPPPVSAPARFLYVGYLRPNKNVAAVLEAVARLAARRRDFVVDVVGDGDQRADLERLARELGIDALVRFHGYRQKEDLPAFFAHCRGLLFQTLFDIWGLVLVEGMAAGVPCLASPNAGATHELIEDGVTGFCVDFTDSARVAMLMERLLDDPVAASRIGRAGSARIRELVSLAKSAAGFVAAVKAAERVAERRP